MRRWLLVLVAVLAACSGPPAAGPSSDAAPASDAAVASDSEGATDAGTAAAALDWTAPLVGGGQLEGGDLAGGDVVLWFWAPW